MLFDFQDRINGQFACDCSLYRTLVGDLLEAGALGIIEIACKTQGDGYLLCIERAVGAGVFEIELDGFEGPAFAVGVHADGDCFACTDGGEEHFVGVGCGVGALE